MRLSLDKEDPGYHPLACHARVFLAGSERRNVLAADDEQRWALLACLDSNGRLVLDHAAGKIKTEDFYGDVRIELPERVRLLIEADRARAARQPNSSEADQP